MSPLLNLTRSLKVKFNRQTESSHGNSDKSDGCSSLEKTSRTQPEISSALPERFIIGERRRGSEALCAPVIKLKEAHNA